MATALEKLVAHLAESQWNGEPPPGQSNEFGLVTRTGNVAGRLFGNAGPPKRGRGRTPYDSGPPMKGKGTLRKDGPPMKGKGKKSMTGDSYDLDKPGSKQATVPALGAWGGKKMGIKPNVKRVAGQGARVGKQLGMANSGYNRSSDYRAHADYWDEMDDTYPKEFFNETSKEIETGEKLFGDDSDRTKKMSWQERFDRYMYRKQKKLSPSEQPRGPKDVGWMIGAGSSAGAGRKEPVRRYLESARKARPVRPARGGGRGTMRAV